MTMQHTSNSTSNSEKPAPEARKADEKSKRPPRLFQVGDVVHYVNAYGLDLGLRVITGLHEEVREWESWMSNGYFISDDDTPWCPTSERYLTMHLPSLPHGCGSWIAESPRGAKYVELVAFEDAMKVAAAGWKVRTAVDHLAGLNAKIREGQA